MKANYTLSLNAVLKHEGGFVNDPQDPGGATNKGVTQAVYDAWRKREGLPKRSVANINFLETSEIYKHQYWDVIKGDLLPAGIDYCLFDFGINSGTARAAKFLQLAVHVIADGQIGLITLAAIPTDHKAVIDTICNMRQEFLERLNTFKRFGKGWTIRVKEVRARAKEMVV